MRAVFDVPMVPPPSQQRDRSGQRARHARNRILNLDFFASLAPCRAGQPANLLQAGPIDVACQSRRGCEFFAICGRSPLPGGGRLFLSELAAGNWEIGCERRGEVRGWLDCPPRRTCLSEFRCSAVFMFPSQSPNSFACAADRPGFAFASS